MKKLCSVVLALTMVLCLFSAFATFAHADTAVVYVDASGNDDNDGLTSTTPVATVQKAFSMIPNGGKIVVVNNAEMWNSWYLPAYKMEGTVVFEGLTANSVLSFSSGRWGTAICVNTVFQNIKLKLNANLSILSNGYDLTFGDGVTVDAAYTAIDKDTQEPKPATYRFCVAVAAGVGTVGGSLTIKSGSFYNAGVAYLNKENSSSRIYSSTGTASLNISGGSVQLVNLGTADASIENAIVKITGGTVGNIDCTGVTGSAILDVSAIATGNFVSDNITNLTSKVTVIEPNGTGYVFVDDNGSDTNNGKSSATAVKTLAQAATLGGTVLVVDTLTLPETMPITALNIEGYNADGSAKLLQSTATVKLGGALTLNNITYKNTIADAKLYANGNALTVNASVKGEGFVNGDTTTYTTLVGGSDTALTANVEMTLNGGRFGDIIVGNTAGVLTGTALLTVNGGTFNKIYAVSNGAGNTTGMTTITLEGGNVGDIELGSSAPATGGVNLVATVETFGKITASATTQTGNVMVDVSTITNSKSADWQTLHLDVTTGEVKKCKPKVYNATEYTLETELAGQNFVYLDDLGSDSDTGKTINNSVKSYEKAIEILGEHGGIIMVVDSYTTNSERYAVPKLANAADDCAYIIRGANKAGNSMWYHNRSNHRISNPTTFDNLTFCSLVVNGNLYANYNRLEITSSVKSVIVEGKETGDPSKDRQYCFALYGGSCDTAGTNAQTAEMIIMGGSYNWIVGGSNGAFDNYNKIKLTFGGNAKGLNRIYACNMGTMNDAMGDVELKVTGGTLADAIYVGSCGKSATDVFVTANHVKVTITGGTFSSIIVGSVYRGHITSRNVVLDVQNYMPARAADWFEKNVVVTDMDGNLMAKNLTVLPEGLFDASAYTQKATEAPTEAPTTPEEQSTEAPETPARKGCGATVVPMMAIIAILGMGLTATKKRK